MSDIINCFPHEEIKFDSLGAMSEPIFCICVAMYIILIINNSYDRY
jgi:hypothetical protein